MRLPVSHDAAPPPTPQELIEEVELVQTNLHPDDQIGFDDAVKKVADQNMAKLRAQRRNTPAPPSHEEFVKKSSFQSKLIFCATLVAAMGACTAMFFPR